ncbi:MAG: fatty acid--CoA ligase [Methylococcaceae bacterium]|nr:fatty acid--CoA ligase [Methylococcaceae bacterium]
MKNFTLQTLAELSSVQAQNRGNAIAFVFEGRTLTFDELNKHANQVAQGLLAEGIKPQARVAMLGKDSELSYEVLFGCAKAKAVLIGINWRLAAQEIVYILNHGQAEILFVTVELLPVIEQFQTALLTVKKIIVLNATHSAWTTYTSWRSQQLEDAPALTYAAEDIALQMYTSGTTGHPKGVQLPNYVFFRVMQGMRAQGDNWMSLGPDDKLLIALPQFHMGGIWWAIQGFIAGAQGVIVDMFVAWKALELIEHHRITKVEMVPSMIQTTLAEPACQTTDFSSVQGFLYGASPIAPGLLRKAMATFNCDFFQVYGLTETGNMAVCLRPEDHSLGGNKKMESAGKPLPGVQVRIIDADNNPLPINQDGEICIKSPANMLGYWQNEAATQQIFLDDWIRTGDVGYIDDEGYVFICDRIKDMIIYGGENIYPAEIEVALSEHDAVAEAAVIGIPDERWGEVIKAFVVLRPGHTVKQRELINFVRGRIADFKAPKSIAFVEALPRNPSGKVLKRMLRIPYWETQERQVN